MKKIIAALLCLMPLAGCWWDSAPETYKGTAEIKFDNGQTVSRDFQCDFRAQQATRSCDFSIDLAKDEIQQAFEQDFSMFKVVLNFSITANARKEDRYMITVQPPFPEQSWRVRWLQYDLFPWKLEAEPVARTEANVPAYVVDADQLDEGFPISLLFDTRPKAMTNLEVVIKWKSVPANSLSS
ncbi:hypothetical protein [Thalassospira sp. MCCC 1A01428]|uniref:hypothetical protein n=1 Tax=Thalassospira sp. MCCC 1A01428 TaxID=1470575 RepID=UPI000A1D607E|nr:hypothetical protein [Thalassospira sp. MCCC 1A01428]OSQ39093.1 hypothetical protein THS27_21565 [Thalassospira sp. MCCC 1A01428]